MHAGFAERDRRDVDERLDLVNAGFLEVTEREAVEAPGLGLDRVCHRGQGTAEFLDRMQVARRRRDAVKLDTDRRTGHPVEMLLQAPDIGAVDLRVGESLVPDTDRSGSVAHAGNLPEPGSQTKEGPERAFS